MKYILALLFIGWAYSTAAQQWPVQQFVVQQHLKQPDFPLLTSFKLLGSRKLDQRGSYHLLQLDAGFKQRIMQEQPAAIQLILPLGNGRSMHCELVKFSMGYITITENNEGTVEHTRRPVSYRGIIKGETSINNVVLAVNDDYISLVATLKNKTLQVTKANEPGDTYRLYNSQEVQFPTVTIDCGTKENAGSINKDGISLNGAMPTSASAYSAKCINVFVDCFDSLYRWRGSNVQQTINYVYELFTAVTTGYLNEGLNIQITTINVWSTTDPYRQTNRSVALRDLATFYKDNFWGNLCVGLDYSSTSIGRSGIADNIGGVKATAANTCPVYTDSSSACCYNDMNYTVNVQYFPTGPNTTGQQVYLVMHEMGHLLGAHHTKWCGWQLTTNPVTYGALDSCGVREGSCAQGPAPSSSGATIMSYCVLGSAAGNFVNFYNGFGTLPGNAIRNYVGSNACIADCVNCYGNLGKQSPQDLAYRSNAGPLRSAQPEMPPIQLPATNLVSTPALLQDQNQ